MITGFTLFPVFEPWKTSVQFSKFHGIFPVCSVAFIIFLVCLAYFECQFFVKGSGKYLSLEGSNRGSPGFLWSFWNRDGKPHHRTCSSLWWPQFVPGEAGPGGMEMWYWALTILPLLVSWLGGNVEFCLHIEQTWAELHLPIRWVCRAGLASLAGAAAGPAQMGTWALGGGTVGSEPSKREELLLPPASSTACTEGLEKLHKFLWI